MKPETGYFLSFDQTKLFYRFWLKQEAPVVVLMVHGFGEHSNRYADLARALGELPVSVIVHDLRGHGESEGRRVHADRFEDFAGDIYHFKSFVEAKGFRDKQFVLLGQSLGGLIATHVALKRQEAWAGLALLSPFFGLPRWEWLLKPLTDFLNPFAGKMIWANPIFPRHLTHDQEAVIRYSNDVLIQKRITIHLAHEMFHAADEIFHRASELSLPLLVLAAGDDKVVSLEKTKSFFERTSSVKKDMRIFNGFYHELIHELDREKPIGELKGYLKRMII